MLTARVLDDLGLTERIELRVAGRVPDPGEVLDLFGLTVAASVQEKYIARARLRGRGVAEETVNAETLGEALKAGDEKLVREIMSSELVTTIGDGFLAYSTLTTVDLSGFIPLTSLGDDFLRDCYSITSIDLSGLSQVTSIGSSFLSGSSSITSIDLSGLSQVTRIDIAFLQWCSSITSIDLSGLSQVTRIGDGFLAH